MSGKHPLVQAVENAQLKTDIPAFALVTLLSFK
jgi:large subunit ribosomal protein L19